MPDLIENPDENIQCSSSRSKVGINLTAYFFISTLYVLIGKELFQLEVVFKFGNMCLIKTNYK